MVFHFPTSAVMSVSVTDVASSCAVLGICGMWSLLTVPPVVMCAVMLSVWSAPPSNPHSLPGLSPPLSGSESQEKSREAK